MTSFTLGAAMAVIQACLKVKLIHLWSKEFTNMFMLPVKLNLSATKLAAAYVACRWTRRERGWATDGPVTSKLQKTDR